MMALTMPDALIHEGLDIFERVMAKVTSESSTH